MPELHVLPTPEEAAQECAAFVADLAEERVTSHGRFTIALSGGATPRRLYQLLAAQPYAERMAWNQWHVFWGDERCVPPDHDDSNYLMAKVAWLDHVPLPPERVHRMRGEDAPEKAAQEYEATLREVFQTHIPSFDLILLGIGEDGHTASLFAGTGALEEKRRPVVANWVPHLQTHRITFTLSLINSAKVVVFLVTEESKVEVVREVLEPATGKHIRPASMVRPVNGIVHWFLTDETARLSI